MAIAPCRAKVNEDFSRAERAGREGCAMERAMLTGRDPGAR